MKFNGNGAMYAKAGGGYAPAANGPYGGIQGDGGEGGVRLPPQNREAEEAVLGSLLIDPGANVEVMGFLEPRHFYSVANGWIYDAMLTLWRRNSPVDTLTLLEELRRREQLQEVGGEPYIIGLVSAVPTSLNAEAYGRIVEETAMRRQMLATASAIASLAWDESKPLEFQLDRAEQAVFEVRSKRVEQNVYGPSEHAMAYLAHLERLMVSTRALAGLDTGLPDLNRVLDGLQRGQLYVLAGRPGMGKTTLGTQIAWYMAQSLKGFYWSGEMGTNQLNNRIVAFETGIPSRKLSSPTLVKGLQDAEMGGVYTAVDKISRSGLTIDTSASITAEQLRSKCLRAYAQGGLDFIVVDHLHLMGKADLKQDETRAVSHNAEELRKLAKLLDVPLLCLAQLSRSVENRQDKRPLLSDLRQAGTIEEVAYAVLLAYRDDYYNPDTSICPGVAELNIAKHRDGPTGVIQFYFDEVIPAFRPLARKEVQL